MDRRGRKTVAQHIFDEIGDNYDEEGLYLVIYDFELQAGETTHHGFFRNLKRIMDRGDGLRVQRSVIECKSLRTARAIELLCRHYSPDNRALGFSIYEIKTKLENMQ